MPGIHLPLVINSGLLKRSHRGTPRPPAMLVATVHCSLTLWDLKTPSCAQPPSSFQGRIR